MPVAGTRFHFLQRLHENGPRTDPERGRRHAVVVSYDPTIYQGAAAHYRYGRPAYSPQLEAVLTEELDLN